MTFRDLAIVIPVFNEEKTIDTVLANIKNKGDVILIDDNSTDSTYSLAKNHKIKIIKNKSNIGYSRSIKKGLLFAKKKKYKYVITFDGDGEHNPNHNLLKTNYTLIIGSRDKKNRIIEKIIGFFTYLYFGVEDPFCGLKGLNLELIAITDKYFISEMEDVNTFLMISMLKKNYWFQNLKINIIERDNDIKSRFGVSINGEIKLLQAIKYWLLK